jgi:ferredoxin
MRGMARPDRRLAHNVAGDFYVDSTCIDCDTCRWMAPSTFVRREEQASVRVQPATPEDERRALMALVSCPTASIGTTDRHDLDSAQDALPDPLAPGLFHCGYHSRDSFGAASWLLQRPDGNVLVDSPRFADRLVRRIEELGGVRWMFLTHRDDVADHAQWRARFGSRRTFS